MIQAFDPDEGANGKVSYSILRGDDYEAFDINSSTGLITTTENLNHLTLSKVTLKISARDSPDTGVPRWVKENAIVTVSANCPQIFIKGKWQYIFLLSQMTELVKLYNNFL